jgi:DNA-binding HxlR family transcriptional regulator
MQILDSLKTKPMRFMDLKDVCRSNRTRSVRLKELEDEGLVKAIPKMIGKKAYKFYEITSIGKEAVELGEKLIQLQRKERKRQ